MKVGHERLRSRKLDDAELARMVDQVLARLAETTTPAVLDQIRKDVVQLARAHAARTERKYRSGRER